MVLDDIQLPPEYVKGISKFYIIACGSSYHVGMVGKYVLEKLLRKPVEVALASEFRYCSPIVDENTLVIVISQSGETLDTMAALREAKRLGARTLSIVNVVGSSIAKEADDVIYTWAGPEIAVATTKALSLIHIYIHGDDGGAAIAEKGEGDADDWEDIEAHADVQSHLGDEHPAVAHADQGGKGIAGHRGHVEAADDDGS